MARFQITSLAVTVCGVLTASVGAFIGYATSATGNYGHLLRHWATATALSLIVLGWQVMRLHGWPRYFTAAIIVVIVAMGVDPLRRLALLGWWAK